MDSCARSSLAVMRLPSAPIAITMPPSLRFKSSRERDRQRIAMISLAAVMTNPSRRGNSVHTAAEPDFDLAQSAVVDIEAPLPEHLFDAKGIAEFDVVVYERGEQVVRRGDCVEVAREVEVDVLHGHHLRVSAAARSALDAEHGTERWLAQGEAGVRAQTAHCVGKPYANRGLALAERRGVHCRDEHEFRTVIFAFDGEFRLEFAVALHLVFVVAQLLCYCGYGQGFCRRRDFVVCKHICLLGRIGKIIIQL